MKKIEAYIKPFRLEEIRSALQDAGISEIRFTQVQESGGPRLQENYRGTGYNVDFDARIMIMMIAEDRQVPVITKIIRDVASTEHASDGRILVIPVESMIEI